MGSQYIPNSGIGQLARQNQQRNQRQDNPSEKLDYYLLNLPAAMWEPIEKLRDNLEQVRGEKDIIITVDTRDWTHLIYRREFGDPIATKFEPRGMEGAAEFLSLEQAVNRLFEWKDKGFNPMYSLGSIECKRRNIDLKLKDTNNNFTFVRLHTSAVHAAGSDKWLFCMQNHYSVNQRVIDALVHFPTAAERIEMEAASQEALDLFNAPAKMIEDAVIISETPKTTGYTEEEASEEQWTEHSKVSSSPTAKRFRDAMNEKYEGADEFKHPKHPLHGPDHKPQHNSEANQADPKPKRPRKPTTPKVAAAKVTEEPTTDGMERVGKGTPLPTILKEPRKPRKSPAKKEIG